MTARKQPPYAPLRVDIENAWVWCGEHRLKLTPKAFAVVCYLAKHAGKLVTKDQLLQVVWPDTVVSEWALTSCLREIRKALADTPKAPQYIETVHRRGLRFIGPVASSQQAIVSREGENQKSKIEFLTLAPNPQHPAPALVGREAELAQLHRWLDKSLAGERHIVFVTGEPGIGKTTLVESFLYGLASREQEESQKAKRKSQSAKVSEAQSSALSPQSLPFPNLRPLTPVPWIARGQCIEHFGAGEAYLPVLEALGRLCREPEHERLIEVLYQHAPTWLVQMPALLNSTELEALQRKVLGATRERMLREMAEALEVLTAERGLVLWFEDLHWSDYSTLDLISSLARRLEKVRLLVIGTYRPVDLIVREHPLKVIKEELQLHNHCQELALELLNETAVAEYLTLRLVAPARASAGGSRGEGLSRSSRQRLARLIHQRTEGNPLFMITLVDERIAQGDLDLEGIADQTPPTLRQLIERQVEQLSPAEQQVLTSASVVGVEFSAAAVAAGREAEVTAVETYCTRLARHGQFLRLSGIREWPDGTVAAGYEFLHALYQEVIYRRLSVSQLMQLHQRIGRRLEVAYGERSREIAAELAVHFERGREYRKAIQYLQQAGENATQRSAYQEAASHFTKGLELLKTLPDTPEHSQQELTLQLALSMALLATKGYAAPEVGKAGTRARELCQQMGDTPQLFPVLFRLIEFYLNRAELQTAHELAEQLMRLAQSVQDPYPRSVAYLALGATGYWLGELPVARLHVEQALTLCDSQQHLRPSSTTADPRLEGHTPESAPWLNYRWASNTADPRIECLAYAVWTLWPLGYPDQALKRSQELLAFAEGLSQPLGRVYALAIAAWCHHLRREVQLTRERAEAVITVATEQGFPYWLGLGTLFRGGALVKQEQVEEGIAQIQQGQATYRATGAEIGRPSGLAFLAEAYGKGGRVEEGLTVLAEALTQVAKTGERYYEAELWRLKGELTLQQENQKAKGKGQKAKIESAPQSDAEACFLKAIEIAHGQQAKSLELRAATSLARLWQQHQKQSEAHHMLSAIYAWFTEGFDTKDLQEAKAVIESCQRTTARP